MKKAIRYLRFSSIGQSNGSIERQELYTDSWLKTNKVNLVDTFIDRGKSAKTFDRPDFIKLKEFIVKYHKVVDYLVVDQLDRFSREAGEALTLVKKLQKQYDIQIVSVTEGIIFDYDTPGNYFRTGLSLLLAEDDNINRSIKVRGGIYTAKAKEGRFIFKNAPFGYRKEGIGKNRILVVEESEAKIVQYIYECYLSNMPLYIIKEKASEMGFTTKGNCAVEKLLNNPTYAGLLNVKAFKDYPGGLFHGNHEPIIDVLTWRMVQAKIKKPVVARTIIDPEIPLRGILKCHCGQPISGAASKGRWGNYFYYYKCKHSKHLNVSAKKSHIQLLDALELMSLGKFELNSLKDDCKKSLSIECETNKKKVAEKRKELESIKEKLFNVEEKWINNEIAKETYERWYSSYSMTIIELECAIERLNKNQGHIFDILEVNIGKLGDLKHVYEVSDTLQKRQLVSLVFDSNLYYKDGVYRTPTMLDALSHNSLKMKEKGVLIYEKRGDDFSIIPPSGERGIRTPGSVKINGFQDRRIRPLCHLSGGKIKAI